MKTSPLALALVVLLAGCGTTEVSLEAQAPATRPAEPPGYEVAEVVRIVDGDTIEVVIQKVEAGPGAGATTPGATYKVRLIGIDTPETVDPRRPVQCFGKEASAAAEALLLDRQVRLVKDVEETDRYDRLLRYVYFGDEMANARLVANGFASAYTYPPNVRHADLFVQLEREARENERGLWSPATCGVEP